MYKELIFRFIEVQILMLSFICFYVCEYIWEFLGKFRSIMYEKWFVVGFVDEKLIQILQYVIDVVYDFRIRLKQLLILVKGKKVKLDNVTYGIIWIVKIYFFWQNTVLFILKIFYEVCLDYLCLLFIYDDIMVFGLIYFIFVFLMKKYIDFFFQKNKGFSDMKVIVNVFKDKLELKKYMKKLMFFV